LTEISFGSNCSVEKKKLLRIFVNDCTSSLLMLFDLCDTLVTYQQSSRKYNNNDRNHQFVFNKTSFFGENDNVVEI
jgi:hypothetical protein